MGRLLAENLNDLERRLLSAATSEEERDSIRRHLEHERRVSHARSIELFLQSMFAIQSNSQKELKVIRKIRQGDAGMMVFNLVAAALNTLILLVLADHVFQ